LKTPREVRNVLRYVLLNRNTTMQERSSTSIGSIRIPALRGSADGRSRSDRRALEARARRDEATTAKPTVWLLTTDGENTARSDSTRHPPRSSAAIAFSTRTVDRSNGALGEIHVEPR